MGRNRTLGDPLEIKIVTRNVKTFWTTDIYAVNAALGSPVTVTLSDTPADGDQVTVQDVGGTAGGQPIAIAAPTNPVLGLGTSFTLAQALGLVSLTFYQALNGGAGAWVAQFLSGAGTNFLAQPAWFVDTQNVSLLANDGNDGATPTTPLLTKKELVRRIGAQNGPIQAPMVVTFMSDDNTTDTTELLFDTSLGFSILLMATAVVVTASQAATATRNLARGANWQTGNQAITAGNQTSATYWSDAVPAAGVTTKVGCQVQDTATGAIGWVILDLGAKQGLIAAMHEYVPAADADPAEAAAWLVPALLNFNGPTDTFVVTRPVKIYTTRVDGGPAQNGLVMVQNLWFIPPNAPLTNGVYFRGVAGYACRIGGGKAAVIDAGTTSFASCYCDSGYTTSSDNAQASQLVSGFAGGATGRIAVDGDIVVKAAVGIVDLDLQANGNGSSMGYVCIVNNCDVRTGQTVQVSQNHYALNAPIVWGGGAGGVGVVRVTAGSLFMHADNGFTGTFLNAGGFLLDGQTNGIVRNDAVNPPVYTSNALPLTNARLDEAVAAGGFGTHGAEGTKGGRIVAN